MTPARGTSTGMRAYISVVLLSLQAAMIVSGGKKLPPKLLECIQHVSLMLCKLFNVNTCIFYCYSEFTETPMMPENVTLNEDVVFRCRHTDAVAYGWYLNGSVLGNNPPPDITPSFNTLTIIALPRNNNTVIECVAFILNGTQLLQERSPSVILIIPGQTLFSL